MVNLELICRQIDEALGCFDRAIKKTNGRLEQLGDADRLELHTLVVAAADSLTPPGSAYRRNFETALKRAARQDQAAEIVGVLRAVRSAYLGNYLASFSQLIRADLFDDFLAMAEHLLANGFKDPAAVLSGGVLEEHLRKLCERHAIPLVVDDRPKAAARMNDELAAAKAYAKLAWKNIAAWIELRNAAAHGKYDAYGMDQVKLMLSGVREFAARTLVASAG